MGGLPSPDVPLENVCTTIFNNTLYAYSYDAFQSLSLKKGSSWVTLPMGVKVSGAACVKATPTDGASEAGFYVVGGKANATMSSYQGLQRYTFAAGKWETLTATDAVTKNRLYHSAAYLNASSSILMYAGSDDGSMAPSSQTFTISTLPPYQVTAFESAAPPLVAPILIPWTQSKAMMVGGSDTNLKVMEFSPSNAWVDTGITLGQPLKNSTIVKAIVINGDDASKTLYTFDMSTSPNSVNRTILINGDGNPQTNAMPINERSLDDFLDTESRLEKRGNLTVAGWPEYNATLAPMSTRQGYAVARDQSGLTVIAGGNTDDVLCMFKARDNCWVNATAQLTESTTQEIQSLSDPDTTTTSSISLATSSQSPTSAVSTSTTDDATASRNLSLKILGIVLGSIAGIALILLLALLFLRWRRKKRNFQEAGHQRRASGIPTSEKSHMDYGDRGIHFNTPRHAQQESQGSFSSMAILMGKVGGGQSRGMLGRRKGSNSSDSSSAFNKKYKTAISNPIPQTAPIPADNFMREDKGVSFAAAAAVSATGAAAQGTKPRASGGRRGSTRRSSGWNRYWSGGSALNIMGFGSKRTTYESRQSAASSNSQYSEMGLPTPATQHSAMPPPLKLSDRPALINRVASGSPTVALAGHDFSLKEGMTGQIERHASVSTMSSYNDDNRDAFSSGVPDSVHEQQTWTPVGGQMPWGGNRGPSVAYSESNYAVTVGRNTMADYNSQQHPMPGFPNPPGGNNTRAPPVPSSDMSWLNLGGSGDRI